MNALTTGFFFPVVLPSGSRWRGKSLEISDNEIKQASFFGKWLIETQGWIQKCMKSIYREALVLIVRLLYAETTTLPNKVLSS